MFCEKCGNEITAGSQYCRSCGAAVVEGGASTVKSVQDVSPIAHNEIGKTLPPGVAGWSWGAFLLNGIWAIGNRTWWGLLAFVLTRASSAV